jgi:hypothetical protein
VALALAAATTAGADLTWRAVWEWSLPKRTDTDLVRLVDSAQALGFNVLLMSVPPGKAQFLADECHRRGMQLYVSTVFTGGEPTWQQVMTPAQEQRAIKPCGETYQSGGEPVTSDELLDTPVPCWNRPEVHALCARKVRGLAALPVDGLAFDFIGYRNYERCHCPLCEAALAAYRRSHSGSSTAQWAEQVLVDFTNEMAAVARAARPDIRLTTHVYPVYAPNPYYGFRLNLDHVGETVSWFFRPHWPLGKVQVRTTQVVSAQGSVWSTQSAAPFIGFDARRLRDYRSARRVRTELEIVERSGATALQMAELGYLLDKPLVAGAVAEALGGSYRGPSHQASACPGGEPNPGGELAPTAEPEETP